MTDEPVRSVLYDVQAEQGAVFEDYDGWVWTLNLGDALGLRHARHDGIDAVTGEPRDEAVAQLLLRDGLVADISTGPRVGVAGEAGTDAFPWRFWIAGDPTVSPFRWGRGARPAAVLD